MFKVIDWETDQVLQEHDSFSKAKRECRKLGCKLVSGEFVSVAFVSDGSKVFGYWCLVYNPRFKTASFAQIKNL